MARALRATCLLPTIGLAIGWSLLPVLAQEADVPANEATQRAASATDTNALTTIVVTAQRRSEDLQEVAVAVSAFEGDALRDVGVTDARSLQNVVPSLTYIMTGFSAQPYVRGIGSRVGWIGMESSVATFIDDRYVARPYASMFSMLDVERVEVLKGPQGMFYGRNSAGGAIHAITREPGYSPSAEIAVKAGDYHSAVLSVLAAGPLADALRGQITAGIEKRDGFAANLVPSGRAEADDLDRQSFRAKLLWDIGDRAHAKLGASWWRETAWTGGDLTSVGVPEANRGVALYGGVTSRDRKHFASAMSGDNDLREAAVDLRFDVHVGDIDFVSITTYTDADSARVFDVDASSTVLTDVDLTEASASWSQEFQVLSSRDQDLEWMAGAYYYREDGNNAFVFRDSVAAQPQFPAGTDLTNGLQRVDSEAYALYAQAAYAFNERWRVSFGGRWNRESKAATLLPVAGAVMTAPTPFADTRDWDAITPRASIEYRGRFGLGYLSYSRGFKSGGYNYPAAPSVVLEPESIDTYEAGSKSDLFGARLRINTAVFSSKIKDLQVSRGAAGMLTTENAADAEVRGLEIDFDVAMAEDLTMYGGAALIHSRYTDYTAGVLVPLYVPPFGSVPLVGGLDVRGRSLLRAPDRALNVGIRYDKRLAGGGSLPLSVNYAYKGDYYFDFSAVPETAWLKQKPYGVLSARIAYRARDERWEVGLWGTNITDEAYLEDAVLTAVVSRVSYADPRLYGIDFKLRL